MRRELPWTLVLAGLLAVPTVSAAEVAGSFAVTGVLLAPAETRITGEALAFLLQGDGSRDALDELRVEAPWLRVRVHERDFTRVGENGLDVYDLGRPRETSFEVKDAVVTLVSERGESYLGVDAAPDSQVNFTPAGRASFEARRRTELVAGSNANPGEPDPAFYRRDVEGPHLLVSAPGAFEARGALAVALYDVTLLIEGRDHRTRLVTGEDAGGEPALPRGVQRWVVLEGPDAAVRAASSFPVQLALGGAAMDADGRLSFRCADGGLSSDQGFHACHEVMDLDGAFRATLRPEPGAKAALRTRLDLEGTLAPASFSSLSAAAPVAMREDAGQSFLWLLALGTVAVGGSGGLLLLRRRRVAPASSSATAEECMDKANDLIQVGDHAAALRWLARARALAPTSASVRASQGFVLGRLGRVDDALQAYQDASRLDPRDGEHALSAARLAHESGRAPDVVEDLLEQALARDARHVAEIEGDGFFAALQGRSRFDHLVERAWKRHVAALSAPDDVEDP